MAGRIWVVRAGEELRYLDLFVERGVVGIGWAEIDEDPLLLSRTELAAVLERVKPDQSPAARANNVGQVWRFIHELAVGDYVLVPKERSKALRVARVTGEATYRSVAPSLVAARRVEWVAEDLVAARLGDDFRSALRGIQTVFEVAAVDGANRLEQVLGGGIDEGVETASAARSGAWVFQANPTIYDLAAEMERSPDVSWQATQHRAAIAPGDRVWVRVTGPSAGIYARARVIGAPRFVEEESGWYVDLVYESKIEPPLLRTESDADPLLGSCTALRGLMGTNLALPLDVDLRLVELLADRQVPVRGPGAESRLLEQRLHLDAERLTREVERDLLAAISELTDRQFEEVCALYLRTLDCVDVEVVGASTQGTLGDGGVDVRGRLDREGLPQIELKVQAKRQKGGVGPNVITQLRGSIGTAFGMVITTSHFTKSAIEEAARPDRVPIRLVDGRELARVLVANGVGARSQSLVVPRLEVSDLLHRLAAEQG